MDDESHHNNKVDDLIKEALSLQSESLKALKNQYELREILQSVISEYLDSFFIFGYDIDGSTIILKNAKSEQQIDALDALATKLFMAGSLMSNG